TRRLAKDRAGLGAAVAAMRSIVSGRVILAGQSYGGRQASMLAANEPELVEGLMLLSYPLHPPGKPGKLRTAHFPQLRTRAMFVQGSNDPFGSIEEIQTALTLIPAAHSLIVVDGAGHDLRRGRLDLGAQDQRSAIGGGEVDVEHLDGGELVEHGPRGEAGGHRPEPGAQRDVHAIGEEGDEDVRLDAALQLVVDRPELQIVL